MRFSERYPTGDLQNLFLDITRCFWRIVGKPYLAGLRKGCPSPAQSAPKREKERAELTGSDRFIRSYCCARLCLQGRLVLRACHEACADRRPPRPLFAPALWPDRKDVSRSRGARARQASIRSSANHRRVRPDRQRI